ncbi:MAG TPA: sigma-54 dependent transcriptional regulator [Sphingorhabdus lacus]|jgi:two-component system nitrogen regulation response regulator NtrX|uniref:Sigma-54-dependent Fis family transcriptional regulator n=1 Tax=Sphingorhabdus lacus TaxID=392610 RepID=A0A6I6L294_9SPHN|nr:sigma-54 dependent transcriptional regulator [Sphingorhabdus lacus]QGY79810.1 sigma-54-dependent Fis family transcriptional regulator [Sphingorhabdus lacus]HNW17720.1 sigma-54 dependent transcriptional regulator [Sphingorhabdus lacus]HPV67399.1 sigma-54 dependent transcriptional regulator [Sphingorhabdus lacus]
MALDILIVDDEQDIRDLVSGVLDDDGYGTRTAATADEALAALDERLPSLILLDVWLRGSSMDGIELLKAIKSRDPQIPVIVFSGHGNIDTAVAAISQGAVDFIEKPFEAGKLLHLVAKATETERLRAENASLRARVGHAEELNGSSGAINTVRATLKKVSGTGSRMLITGPAGVGKEVAARLLHSWSPRAESAFVSVSAARLSPERFDEELFGIEQDGRLVQAGMLEKAHGGTLFLDEVADMPWTTQGKILRVLTDQSFMRVGGDRQIRVDVRFVSATARDLATEIAEGRFREDLFYRLNVVPVEIPPLASRREDIPDLANHYAARFASEHRIAPPVISDDAMAALQACEWPGNVRQLRNIIERTIILAPSNRIHRIEADMLPSEIINSYEGSEHNVTSLMGAPLREAREAFEREYLRVQIKRFSGNISKTAAFVGMERSALHRKLKLLGISVRKNGDEGGDEED